jgi:hypothetical protein
MSFTPKEIKTVMTTVTSNLVFHIVNLFTLILIAGLIDNLLIEHCYLGIVNGMHKPSLTTYN